MPIRQADVPNQCSSSNEIYLKTFMLLLHLHCPSGASLRYAVCHTSCSSYGIRHGSYCVLHATSFITSFVPLHYTRSQLTHLLQGRASLAKPQKPCIKGMHQPFASQPYNTHRVPFRFTTSSIHFSSVQSTRCPLFGSPCVPISAAFTLRLLIAHVVPPFRKASLRFTCIVQPPPYPDGKFTAAASYGGSIVVSPLPWLLYIGLKRGCHFTAAPSWVLAGTSGRSSLQCLMAARHPRYSVDKCATRLYFFFCRRRYYLFANAQENVSTINICLKEKKS
jgi:hypothetical protein